MCRAHRSWCRKLVQFNLWATLYSSWVLGLFPFIYVSRTRSLQRSRWLVVYGIVLNVLVVWVLFKSFAATKTGATEELFKRNPLVHKISQIQDIVLLMTFFLTYFRNWWVSEELCRILNMLLDLHHRHIIKFDSSDCKKFDNYILYKGSCIMLELITMILMQIVLDTSSGFQMILGFITVLFMQLGVLLVSMHFHLAVMYIYRSVWIINRELLRLVNQLRVFGTAKSSRVYKFHCLYKRLLELNLRLVAIYDYQITLLMVSLFSINITSPFYVIVYAISLKKPITIFMGFNFLQALSVNIMDIWLNFAVCELAVRASQGTARILKLFNDIPDLTEDLERSVSICRFKLSEVILKALFFQLTDFALFSSHQRLKYNHFGMFDVHNAMGFRMLIACTLYLVYLVQFDFMNL